MLTESQVSAIANEVLGTELGASGFASADVRSANDHDGDPSLYVTVHLAPRSGVIDGATSGRAHVALRRRLFALDEERITYLRYRYPDDEALVGDDESGTA